MAQEKPLVALVLCFWLSMVESKRWITLVHYDDIPLQQAAQLLSKRDVLQGDGTPCHMGGCKLNRQMAKNCTSPCWALRSGGVRTPGYGYGVFWEPKGTGPWVREMVRLRKFSASLSHLLVLPCWWPLRRPYLQVIIVIVLFGWHNGSGVLAQQHCQSIQFTGQFLVS